MSYALLIAAWIMYFFLHSFLATDKVKSKFPGSARNYRLLYSAFSTVALLLLLFYNAWIGGDRLFGRSDFLKYISLFLAGGGVLIINAAFRNYSARAFLGLTEEPDQGLVTSGINAWVRHPLYSGTILITLGFFLFDPRAATLISVACVWIYLLIGIRLEERKLILRYGKAYEKYREEVAAIIPFLL
ncbi:methyltransferase family protein [Fulvivirga sedimenti]|uniref:Isoprenylcysteine carboxylmethyltransferase family protein n=1 Tax=Fulvivirga sedimenti TaxID=2879465 RepID=A0A9X1KWX7_9BACT|nr:isoprenylcysteine carboxylmethyltransferase family protein [Fulvivirga sedimenti]MCA6074404.1 isoprenylcysteine carboxylmethyltransferase family protein [Fulvivirga sedimenti]